MRFACGPPAYLKNPREKRRKQWTPCLTVKDNRTRYSDAEYIPDNSGLYSFRTVEYACQVLVCNDNEFS